MATPHNEANLGDIAKVVIMPGDPLRAQFIAKTYLKDVKQFNSVRNMFGYTGTYKGKLISVMGSGMGMPSMGIYSYELFKFYDVDTIIRVGSTGAYTEDLKLYDLVLADSSWSESSYAKAQSGDEEEIMYPSKEVNTLLLQTAKDLHQKLVVGRVHSSDVFYHEDEDLSPFLKKGCLCVEMESFALFHNAKVLKKKAACLFTVSDSLITHEQTSSKERQEAFHEMIELALESALKL